MAEVQDSDFVSEESCNDTEPVSSLSEEIVECEVKQETVVTVAEGDVENPGTKSDFISGRSSFKEKEELIVSLAEKKQEIEEARSVAMSELGKCVEGMFQDWFCFSGNGTENLVNIEKESFLGQKEVLFFSEVQESDNSDHSMKPSEEGMNLVFEYGKKVFGDLVSEPQKLIEVISSTVECEKSSDNFLGMEETNPVIESELGSILEAQRTWLEDIGSKNRGESMEEIDKKHGSLEIEAGNADNILNNLSGCIECASGVKDLPEMLGSDGDKMKGFNGMENLVENSLQNEVKFEIPVTVRAFINVSRNDCGKKGKGRRMNEKKDGKEGKKGKYPKRRAKGMKKVSDVKEKQNMLSLVSEARNVCLKRGEGSKISYSRNELEALRFVTVEGQQIMWNEIYHGLGPFVARELKGMADSKLQKQGSRNIEHHQGIVKSEEHSAVSSEVCSQNLENNFTKLNPLDLSCGDYVNSNDNLPSLRVNASDSNYDDIRRRAFLVEGEPDFDSGPRKMVLNILGMSGILLNPFVTGFVFLNYVRSM